MEMPPTNLLTALALALLTLVVTLTPLTHPHLRTALGILMILFISGYAILAALFPKRGVIEGLERTALSMGLSTFYAAALGFILKQAGLAVTYSTLGAALAISTVMMVAIAHWRRMKIPEDERHSSGVSRMLRGVMGVILSDDRSWLNKFLTVFLLIVLILSIVLLVYIVISPKTGEKFTEFYILGPGGKAEGYPTGAYVGEQSMVIVGVVNHEYRIMNYTMRILLNNTPWNNSTWKQIPADEFGKLYPVKSLNMTLAHNETWKRPVSYTLNHTGLEQKLDFLLYSEGNFTAPYRDLHLWVNVTRNVSTVEDGLYLKRAEFYSRK